MLVTDVSQYNGSVSWKKVAKNFDGVVIRCGYRGYGSGKLVTDKAFKRNMDGAALHGVPVGVYFATQAINEAEARQEAAYVLDLVKGYNLSFPIFIDSENGNDKGTGRADRGRLSRKKRTDILLAFCQEIKSAGYAAGVYASETWYKNDLDNSRISGVYRWVAKYSKVKPSILYDAWQYSNTGVVEGIPKLADLSDFSSYKVSVTDKTPEEIALEVIEGKWGSASTDPTRKELLTAAGYDYNSIQTLVNAILAASGDQTHASADHKAYYTVKAGDSMSKIAKKYDMSLQELLRLNNLKDPNKINIGQKIRIR